MVITRLTGGLGNQMFQYAAGRRLACVRGVPLKLDVSIYRPEGDCQPAGLEAFRRHLRVDRFDIAAEPATAVEVAAVRDPHHGSSALSRVVRQVRRFRPGFGRPATDFTERQYRFDPAVLTLSTPRYLAGAWQSEKYFADVADVIRRDFTPRDPAARAYADGYVGRLRAEGGGPVVSVHVRRGDLAHAREVLGNDRVVYGPPTGTDYVGRAIARFDAGSTFLVFSDSARDIAWCKQNLPAGNLHFSEGHDDVQDMMIMSACDHHVIASTYSWWAAWLNARPHRRVVAPLQWSHPGGEMVPDDLVPPGWEMV